MKRAKRGRDRKSSLKHSLNLPDLDQAKSAVLNSLPSKNPSEVTGTQAPDPNTLKGKRDRALLGVLLGCGLRRREAAELDLANLQRREDHWAIVDLVGKARHIRTAPVPDWVKSAIDSWLVSAGVSEGRVFRRVCRAGKTWGNGVTERVVWHVVRECAKRATIENLAPHDLRRTCARLCREAGGELEQIQFLLGHVSIQTTERYLGGKQRIRGAVNDRIGNRSAYAGKGTVQR